jgi:hypothetical protein
VLALDFVAVPLNHGPNDHKQLFNFSVGLFDTPPMSEPVKPEPAVPQMSEPVKPELPVPQMPQPVEPGLVDPAPQIQVPAPGVVPRELEKVTLPTKPAKQKKAKPSVDPVGRVQGVIDQSPDLKRIRDEVAPQEGVRVSDHKQLFNFSIGVFGNQ